jgi:hypothetical protein
MATCCDHTGHIQAFSCYRSYYNIHETLIKCGVYRTDLHGRNMSPFLISLYYLCYFSKITQSWGARGGAVSMKVAGSIHWHNPTGRAMVLGSTQHLTEMSTRNISWGVKEAGAYGWQTYQFYVPIVLKFGSLNFLESSGPVQACNGIAFLLPLHNREEGNQ